MQFGDPLGFGIPHLTRPAGTGTEHIIVKQPLHRVLNFLGCSIDDVCNNPIIKNKVYGFYKLHKQVERSSEISELERWWNGPGLVK